MRGKKLAIIVMAALGVVSFVVSFLLSGWLGDSPQSAQAGTEDAAAQQQELDLPELAAAAPAPPQVKELDELIREMRLRMAEYSKKDKQLQQREKRLQLAQELLKKQATELESLRMELSTPLTRLKEAQAELQQSRVSIAKQEEANLKKTAAIYEKMDPASGSEYLTEMCANKQEQDVVKILYLMSERSAAKVLAEMTDTSLAARLTEMMKRIQQEG
jgi:flagellar motility protein MotE (MotC chaperone)